MVFVRFGGPVFEDAHTTLATIVGSWVAALLYRKAA